MSKRFVLAEKARERTISAMATPHVIQPWDAKAQVGVAGVIGSFFTVVEVAKIITLWPRHERLSNSWKINERIRAHCMEFLATLITAATERRWLL